MPSIFFVVRIPALDSSSTADLGMIVSPNPAANAALMASRDPKVT
jgi:hypothetical protein